MPLILLYEGLKSSYGPGHGPWSYRIHQEFWSLEVNPGEPGAAPGKHVLEVSRSIISRYKFTPVAWLPYPSRTVPLMSCLKYMGINYDGPPGNRMTSHCQHPTRWHSFNWRKSSIHNALTVTEGNAFQVSIIPDQFLGLWGLQRVTLP